MPKKLLHLVFGAERGGCEHDALMVIQGSTNLQHEVVNFGDEGPMCDEWAKAEASVMTLGKKSAKPFAISQSLSPLLKQIQPNAAIIWHGLIQLPQLIRTLNSYQIPHVVHGGNPAHTMPARTDWQYYILSKLFRSRGPLPTYLCCSKYVANSFETSRYLRQFRREVVYNGVKQPRIPLHTPRQLTPHGAPVIGMLARLSSIKDHATLLRAMPLILNSFPNTTLELAGDGDQLKPLQELAEQLQLSKRVVFLGDVSNVYEQMSRWDLFAYATTEREGLGNALAEAMTFGLPCVVTDVGPMREFAGPESDCISLVPAHSPEVFAKRVIEILENEDQRTQLSLRGRDFARDLFCPTNYAKQHLKILAIS